MPNSWKSFTASIQQLMGELSFCDQSGKFMAEEEGFTQWVEMTMNLKGGNGCLYLVGNGASASMSSHFAADIHKNAHIHTQVFTDLALITAMANDLSYEQVFAYPLRRSAKEGDILLTISSSGASPNILQAIDAALEMGLRVVTVSAMRAENPSRRRGHLNVYIPAMTYGHAETVHAAILHHWTDLLVAQHQVNMGAGLQAK